MLADMDTLYLKLKGIHPNMFTVISQDDFERNWEKARGSLKDSATVFDFYSVVAPLVASIGDGHTFIGLPAKQLLQDNVSVLPLKVDIDKRDSSIRVTSHFTHSSTPIDGMRILNINGKDHRSIIKTLSSYTGVESPALKLEILERYFESYLYMSDRSDVFTITLGDNGRSRIITLPAIPIKHFNERAKAASSKSKTPPYTLSTDARNNTAVFDLRRCDYKNGYLHKFLDSAFTLLKTANIGNLIIDIRENPGGQVSVGDEIFQYISPRPFCQIGQMSRRVSPTIRNYMIRHGGYKESLSIMDTLPDGIHTIKVDTLAPLRDNPLRYNGSIYLLTSTFTASAAATFAWAFKYFDMGTVIGEETGGHAVCFIDCLPASLPNTRL